MKRENLLGRSKVFCMAPWTHLHVPPKGSVNLCCDAANRESDAIGHVRQGDSLRSVWNGEAMREIRRSLLAGRPVAACERCYEQEAIETPSYRHWFNQRFAHHFDLVEETAPDGSVPRVNLPFLDIRFSNLCNLSCRICSLRYSTSWHADSAALGLAEPRSRALSLVDEQESLWAETLELLPQVEQIHFAGGEPLIMEEHYRLLEELIRLGLTHVQLRYNTNLTRLRLKSHDVVTLWQHFPNVTVEASLDGSGSRGDYMRKGQRWPEVVANRERMQRECPHVEFRIHATVGLMNALHLPDFYREWTALGLLDPHQMDPYALRSPAFLNVQALPPHLKRQVDAKIRALVEDYLPTLSGDARVVATRFEAVRRFMHQTDLDVRSEFRWYTESLDRLRSESFEEVFPELADLLAPESDLERLEWAQDALLAGENALARRRLEAICRFVGERPQAASQVARAQTRLAEGDDVGGLACLARAVGEAERASDRFGNRFVTERRLGRSEKALWALRASIRTLPARTFRALDEPIEGAADDAELRSRLGALFQGGSDLFVEPAFAYYARGLARRELGEAGPARRDFERAVALAPPGPLLEACRQEC